MDPKERQELITAYSQMSDEEIIKILLEDEQAYKQNPYPAYDLLMNEAKKRQIDGRIKERKKEAEAVEKMHHQKIDFEIVFSGTPTEAGFAKNILEMKGIPAFLRDEMTAMIAPHYVSPVLKGVVKVVVERKSYQEAKTILDEYLN